jgi:hypothetical protein
MPLRPVRRVSGLATVEFETEAYLDFGLDACIGARATCFANFDGLPSVISHFLPVFLEM